LRSIKKPAASAIVLGFGAFASRAADPTDQKADGEGDSRPAFEEHVTVVARPIVDATKIDDHANPVTAATADQIRDLNAQDVDNALRRVPGVVISRCDPIGNYGSGDGRLRAAEHGARRVQYRGLHDEVHLRRGASGNAAIWCSVEVPHSLTRRRAGCTSPTDS
jgi:hypothetical protein